MAYRVELTERAERDLRRLYLTINATHSTQARTWFLGLEDASLHHALYGRGRNVYRIIHAIDEPGQTVTVLHIRHGARGAFIIVPSRTR